MSENRAVMWMITSGEYGDWSVHGIYTDKAEAERAAELANRDRNPYEDEYCVEEVAALDGIMPRRAETLHIIGFPLKGGFETEERPQGTQLVFGRQAPTPYVDYSECTGMLYVSGETEAARKAYAEHAARIKADTEENTRCTN